MFRTDFNNLCQKKVVFNVNESTVSHEEIPQNTIQACMNGY